MARVVQFALDARPFARSELATGTPRVCFVNTNPRLFRLQSSGLAPRQFAAAYAFANALLLLAFTSVDAAMYSILRPSRRWKQRDQECQRNQTFRPLLVHTAYSSYTVVYRRSAGEFR